VSDQVLEMLRNMNPFRSLSKLILHPLIHSFSLARETTTCGGSSEKARMGIKVCYMKSHWNGRRVYIITLKLESVLGQRVQI
jgi:hypothetical protein